MTATIIDGDKLLKDLIKLKNYDEEKIGEAETIEEMYTIKGSIINLATIIEFIQAGKYDKS